MRRSGQRLVSVKSFSLLDSDNAPLVFRWVAAMLCEAVVGRAAATVVCFLVMHDHDVWEL